MALNSLEEPEDEDRSEPSEEESVRWRNLFNHSCAETANLIKEERTIRGTACCYLKYFSRDRVYL